MEERLRKEHEKLKEVVGSSASATDQVAEIERVVSERTTELRKLHEELAKMEQGVVDKNSLMTSAKELCTTALLQHKDNGVKALVACCLADMLKLHAPDAPYTVNQLRVGFLFERIATRLFA